MTGAEKVLKWYKESSEQNGTPTPFEVRCQLEMAIEEEKSETKNSHWKDHHLKMKASGVIDRTKKP